MAGAHWFGAPSMAAKRSRRHCWARRPTIWRRTTREGAGGWCMPVTVCHGSHLKKTGGSEVGSILSYPRYLWNIRNNDVTTYWDAHSRNGLFNRVAGGQLQDCWRFCWGEDDAYTWYWFLNGCRSEISPSQETLCQGLLRAPKRFGCMWNIFCERDVLSWCC